MSVSSSSFVRACTLFLILASEILHIVVVAAERRLQMVLHPSAQMSWRGCPVYSSTKLRSHVWVAAYDTVQLRQSKAAGRSFAALDWNIEEKLAFAADCWAACAL